MKRPWKWVGLATGVTAVLAGSLLLMGNLHDANRLSRGSELARVEALARHWETRLEAVRSVFRDQIMRCGLMPVLEHPADYAPWRVEPKLSDFEQSWPADAGSLRGLAVVAPDYSVHTMAGDTSGASDILRHFGQNSSTDIALVNSSEDKRYYLGLQYSIIAVDDQQPAVLLALLDPSTVLPVADHAPQAWALLSDPHHALFSSQGGATNSLVNAATWPLLVGQESGTLQRSAAVILTFSKVHVKGMPPLLLVTSTSPGVAASGVLPLILVFAGATLLLIIPDRKLFAPAERDKSESTQIAAAAASSVVSQPLDRDDISELMPDPHSPFPILYVSPEGLIHYYNNAALRVCSKIKDTPLLTDVLTTVEAKRLPPLLSGPAGTTFESLFGSAPYRFEVVPTEDSAILYGHPLSVSQSLGVALEQAQESFNALCAVSPYPILLIDPRNHSITEANDAAAALFGTTLRQLQGRILDSLSSAPVDLTASRSPFEAETPRGHIDCTLHCAIIKVEGVPTVVAMLETTPLELAVARELNPTELDNAIRAEAETSETQEFTLASPILVSYSPVVRDVCRRLLEKTGHNPEVFSTLGDATTWVISQGNRPEFVVVDITDFPDAPDWLTEIRQRFRDLPCMAITDGVTDGLPAGPNAMLVKPFDLDSVMNGLTQLGLSAELELAL